MFRLYVDNKTGNKYISKDIKSVIYVNKKKNEKLHTLDKFKTNIDYIIPTPGLEPGPRLGQGFKPCMSTNSII